MMKEQEETEEEVGEEAEGRRRLVSVNVVEEHKEEEKIEM